MSADRPLFLIFIVVSNIYGARWFVSFIDDCSWVTWPVVDDCKCYRSVPLYIDIIHISRYVSTKQLSTQYQSFIVAVDYVRIKSSIEETFKNINWAGAMNDKINALEKNIYISYLRRIKQYMHCIPIVTSAHHTKRQTVETSIVQPYTRR